MANLTKKETRGDEMEVKMQAIARQVYESYAVVNQYSVAEIAFHKHSGRDSAKIPFTNRSDVPDG